MVESVVEFEVEFEVEVAVAEVEVEFDVESVVVESVVEVEVEVEVEVAVVESVEERKNKYLAQELQKKKNDIESINGDIKKMKKVIEKNNEQERVLKKEEVFLQKMIEFTRNHSNT